MDAGQTAKLRSALTCGTNTYETGSASAAEGFGSFETCCYDREQLSSGAGAANHALHCSQ